MTRGAAVGVAAIVLMVTEPWWGPLLHYRPRPRPERPTVVTHETPTQVRIIRRGTSRELERRGGS